MTARNPGLLFFLEIWRREAFKNVLLKIQKPWNKSVKFEMVKQNKTENQLYTWQKHQKQSKKTVYNVEGIFSIQVSDKGLVKSNI